MTPITLIFRVGMCVKDQDSGFRRFGGTIITPDTLPALTTPFPGGVIESRSFPAATDFGSGNGLPSSGLRKTFFI